MWRQKESKTIVKVMMYGVCDFRFMGLYFFDYYMSANILY